MGKNYWARWNKKQKFEYGTGGRCHQSVGYGWFETGFDKKAKFEPNKEKYFYSL